MRDYGVGVETKSHAQLNQIVPKAIDPRIGGQLRAGWIHVSVVDLCVCAIRRGERAQRLEKGMEMLRHVGGVGTEYVRGFGMVDDLVPARDDGGNHHPGIRLSLLQQGKDRI
jgi:hypothetical protein